MKTINVAQLEAILATVKGASAINISALVDTGARKTGNPFAEVLKLSKVNGMTGTDYENGVNNQQMREGNAPTFVVSPRKWGVRISPALVEHKGRKYLSFRPLNTTRPTFFARQSSGVLLQVSKETVAKFLPAQKSSAPAQGVQKEIFYRDYALDSITSLSIGGEKYRVRH